MHANFSDVPNLTQGSSIVRNTSGILQNKYLQEVLQGCLRVQMEALRSVQGCLSKGCSSLDGRAA